MFTLRVRSEVFKAFRLFMIQVRIYDLGIFLRSHIPTSPVEGFPDGLSRQLVGSVANLLLSWPPLAFQPCHLPQLTLGIVNKTKYPPRLLYFTQLLLKISHCLLHNQGPVALGNICQ